MIYWLLINNKPRRDRHKARSSGTHPKREQIYYSESTGQKREATASGLLPSVRLLDEECLNGVKHDLAGESFCDTFCVKSIKRDEYRRYSKELFLLLTNRLVKRIF